MFDSKLVTTRKLITQEERKLHQNKDKYLAEKITTPTHVLRWYICTFTHQSTRKDNWNG